MLPVMMRIDIYPTYYEFICDKACRVNTARQDVRGFVNKLSEWVLNPKIQKYQVAYRYVHYDHVNSALSMPINTLGAFREYLHSCGIPHTVSGVSYVNPRKVKIEMQSGMVPREHQYPLIEYLVSDRRFKALSASTGAGKTILTMFAMCELGHPTIVFTGGLVEQWRDQLLEKTKLTADDVYVIKGNDSIQKLWLADEYKPKVFIASIRTMSMYAKADRDPYMYMPTYLEFQQRYGLGMSVVDETHLDFHANTCIALRSRIKHNIFLSATYGRSSREGARIFDMIFPKEIVHGNSTTTNRHVHVTLLGYRLGNPKFSVDGKFILQQGYSHNKYEGRMLAIPSILKTFLQSVLNPSVDLFLHVRKPGQKILIFAGTIRMAEAMTTHIQARHPSLRIVCFHGDAGDDCTVDVDVIVSTLKKSSTGRDIKDLVMLVNTISFKSFITCRQMVGRLREIPNNPTYCYDFFNVDLQSHVRHVRDRKSVYSTLAASLKEVMA